MDLVIRKIRKVESKRGLVCQPIRLRHIHHSVLVSFTAILQQQPASYHQTPESDLIVHSIKFKNKLELIILIDSLINFSKSKEKNQLFIVSKIVYTEQIHLKSKFLSPGLSMYLPDGGRETSTIPVGEDWSWGWHNSTIPVETICPVLTDYLSLALSPWESTDWGDVKSTPDRIPLVCSR